MTKPDCEPNAGFSTLVELLRTRAIRQSDLCAYTFLVDGDTEEDNATYGELDLRARAIGGQLQALDAAGERVLLLYPPGLEYIAAFFGCLYAGAVAVPAYPPRPNRSMPLIQAIVADSQPKVALATRSLLANIERQLTQNPHLAAMRWLATDEIADELAQLWQEPAVSSDTLAFLQYTSGSTGTPKGVMVSHGNLLHCEQTIQRAFEHTQQHIGLGWLPLYHDMGLIGNVLQALYVGRPCILLSPMAFLQKPFRWLEAISRYKVTTSGGPNFAYELCVRKITAQQRASLDLTSWQVAFTGAEPVRAETLERFAAAFEPCGFHREAFYPCYGMAEATLIVSGGLKSAPPVLTSVQARALEQNRIVPVAGEDDEARTLVGCGKALPGQQIVIAHADTLRRSAEGQIGEIWTSGPNVTQGYWNRPEETEGTFGAYLADTGEGPFLRTGDLGFLKNGELFVTGRLKNVIIIRGRNHYPQDIELTVEQSHPALRPGCGAAFSADLDGEERLVVAQEVKRSHLRNLQVDEVVGAIRQAISERHELEVYAVLLLKTSSIPKTSSGKIQHHACRAGFLQGSLQVVGHWRQNLESDNVDGPLDEGSAKDSSSKPTTLETAEAIQAWLVARLAARLNVAAQDIDVRQPFARYGLDSVAAVSLAEALEQQLGRPLAPTLAFDYPNIQALARHLAGEPDVSPGTSCGPYGNKPEADPIAVIGLGCRFPGAEGPEAFWQLMRDGVDAITEVPRDRWDVNTLSEASAAEREGLHTRWGGFLQQVDRFDPQFFGISPREAESMDPQQRLLLEVSWEALEHAAVAPDRLAGSQTGVFVGISSGDYARLQFAAVGGMCGCHTPPAMGGMCGRRTPPSRRGAGADAYASTGNALSIAANRLSYVLDLRGPSWAVDTACSSSLVAVHQACRSLRQGECDLALAGGVNLILSPDLTIAFSRADLMAADGRCKTFDAAADGYVRGEGCGMVVLKRLSDAVRDKDSILAVIRGSAVNQDGRSNGLTAPNGPSQQAVVRQALKDAGVAPAQVTYVEAHGTGTPLGDPIEVNSLKEVLLDGRAGSEPCWIGSVKTNIGHLEAAAGIAGLIKVVLALGQSEIPPNLHLKTLNPQIALEDGLLSIPTELQPWPAGQKRRFAGVSSFGFGGTNVHVILEEAPGYPLGAAPAANEVERPVHVLTLSAKDDAALRHLAHRYESFLACHPEAPVADVCFTANTGRSHFGHRLSVLGESTDQLRQRLSAFALGEQASGLISGRVQSWTQAPEGSRIAFLFTGQGSQYLGMGRQLYQTQPTFRRALDRCDDLLWPYLEQPLLSVLYPVGTTSLLDQTVYTQPALFALEYALAELWKSWGIEPELVLGHSLGEYVAACVAGVFSLEDALKLTAERSRLIQALPEDGQMVAVMAGEARVAAAIEPYAQDISLAAVNACQQVVISGRRQAVRQVVAQLEADGVRTRPLRVSHAFHSPLMEPILPEFEQLCREVAFSPPQIGIISNLYGKLVSNEIATGEYWCQHVRQPVRFAAGMAVLEQQGTDVVLEIGPKPTLLGMGRRCLPNKDRLWLPSLRESRGDWQQLLESLGELYVRGVPVDWQGFDRDYSRQKVVLPTYPFQRERYWIKASQASPGRFLSSKGTRPAHPLLGYRLHSAGKEVVFQCELRADGPAFLADHRIYQSIVLPASAYLEMALAAARDLRPSEDSVVEDLAIQQALRLPADEIRTVQMILVPEESNTYSFQVFSCVGEEETDEPSWTKHASGKLAWHWRDASGTGQDLPPAQVNLAALQVECCQEVSVDQFYQQLRQRGIDYGPRFRGVQRLWRGHQAALGEIRLPESLEGESEDYYLHPVLLDACLQVLGAAFVEAAPNTSYLFVGIKRMRLFRRPGPLKNVWSHAQFHPSQGPSQPESTADVQLFSPDGEVIAVAEGLRLKQASREAILAQQQSVVDGICHVPSTEDLLYEIQWRPQARRVPPASGQCMSESTGKMPVSPARQSERLAADYPPAPSELGDRLADQLAKLSSQLGLESYRKLLGQLEALSVAYVLRALQEMGWKFQLNQVFSTAFVAEHLGVVDQHRRLLGRLLEMLREEGVLQRIEDGWQVASRPELQDPQHRIDGLLAEYPAARAELTLLARCGSRLADVLRGACDPLDLLFPQGDLATATKLYQDSPGARVINAVVREAVLSVSERLPQGRTLRVLEIGAGTGGTTSAILPHLPADRTEYSFTDVSALFIAKAEEKFRAYPFVRYQVLDIEQPPERQGFRSHQYEIVVAANVLHATRDLRETLRHVRQLLAPGGMLVLAEGTTRQRWLDLIFGLTEGWWRFADEPLRTSYPLLASSEWQTLLAEVGFQQSVTIAPDPPKRGDPAEQAVIIAQGPKLDTQQYVAGTRRVPMQRAAEDWLILADRQGVGSQLATMLRWRGERCTLAFRAEAYTQVGDDAVEIAPARTEEFQRLIEKVVGEERAAFRGIVHLWSLDAPEAGALTADELESASRSGCGSVLCLIQSLISAQLSELPSLWLVTRGAQPVGPHPEVPGVAQSPLWGLGKVIALEHPELKCVRVDLDPAAGAASAEALFEEIWTSQEEDQVAFRDGQRYVPRLVRGSPTQPSEMYFRCDGTYLITGGLGSLGLRTARWMVEHGVRHLALIGRKGLPSRDAWASILRPPDSRTARQVEAVRSLEEMGAVVAVHRADVSDPAQISAVLEQLKASQPPLLGIIHAAGVAGYQTIQKMELEELESVLRPKMIGAWLLKQFTERLGLEFFVCFSSTSSVWGAKGHGHYAAANQFLDAFAHHCRSLGARAFSINWGLWAGGGLVDEAYRAHLAQIGMDGSPTEQAFDAFGGRGNEAYRKWLAQIGVGQLQPEQGFDALGRLLRADIVQATVAKVDWKKFTSLDKVTGRRPLLTEVRSEGLGMRGEKSLRPNSSCLVPRPSPLISDGHWGQVPARRSQLLHQCQQASGRQRRLLLMDYVQEQIAQVLGLSTSQMDVEQPLNNMGLDSLMAIELRDRVKADLGVEVPMVTFVEGPSIAGMATFLAEQLTDQPRGEALETRGEGDGAHGSSLVPRPSSLAPGDRDWIEGEL